MGRMSLKSLDLNDGGRQYGGSERNGEFVVARHFVEVA